MSTGEDSAVTAEWRSRVENGNRKGGNGKAGGGGSNSCETLPKAASRSSALHLKERFGDAVGDGAAAPSENKVAVRLLEETEIK
jgi:hypothetical protein